SLAGDGVSSAEGAGTQRVRGVRQGHGRPAGVDDDGVRDDPSEAVVAQRTGQVDCADHSGRGADLRYGGVVPAGGYLLASWAALRAGRPGQAALLQRSEGRADP